MRHTNVTYRTVTQSYDHYTTVLYMSDEEIRKKSETAYKDGYKK